MADLLIIGAGLIGTSIGLALSGDRDVVLRDARADHLGVAVARGAGREWDGEERCEITVVCVPPSRCPQVVQHQLRLGLSQTVSHVCSIQSPVLAALQVAGTPTTNFCGSHPMAGSERTGPEAALRTLFAGRPWAICPAPDTDPAAAGAMTELATACGADPAVLSPAEHDEAVAITSQLPQLAASALAAQLVDYPAATRLAGPGLADSTRLAASDPAMWREILAGAGPRLAPLLERLASDLGAAAAELATAGLGAGDALAVDGPVVRLLERGREGRRLVPGKQPGEALQWVPVDVPDRPGALADVFAAVAAAGVNVEDIRIQHLPRRTGILLLGVSPADEGRLLAALRPG